MARRVLNHAEENDCLQLQMVLTCNVVHSHTMSCSKTNNEGQREDEEGTDIEEEEE
jgi:hypothetical protein